jgi:hypothetical protein
VAPIRAERAPLVAVGFSDASLAWAMRPDDVPRLALDTAEIVPVLDRLFAPGARRVVAAVKTRDWKEALRLRPGLAERARAIWERRVGPWIFTVVAPASPASAR